MSSDLVFINVRKPKDALNLAKESHVRSHVTRRQWRQFEERSQAVEKVLKKAKHDDTETHTKDVAQHPKHPFRQPLPRPIGGLREDPLRSYPVSWRPFLPQLVDHCTFPEISRLKAC